MNASECTISTLDFQQIATFGTLRLIYKITIAGLEYKNFANSKFVL